MKKCFKMFLMNGFLGVGCYVCYFFPEYWWGIKIIFYILIPLGIIGNITYILKIEKIPKKIKEKFDSDLYIYFDIIFDLIWICTFIFLGFKIIFILYIVNSLFSWALIHKYRSPEEFIDNNIDG